MSRTEQLIAYSSQFGQDEFIDKAVLHGKKNGFFIEIGAYDGITCSNSYFFEKYRDWKGLCIEPIPEQFEKLHHNRTCECLFGAISTTENRQSFLHVKGGEKYGAIFDKQFPFPKLRGKEHSEMLSGLVEKYHPSHLELIEKELAELGGEMKKIEVPCFNLHNLITERKIEKIDYLSVDTEGGELEILAQLDFKSYVIDIISVEVLYPDLEVETFMEERQYEKIAQLGYDHIYRASAFIEHQF